jgi:uncharacterized protein
MTSEDVVPLPDEPALVPAPPPEPPPPPPALTPVGASERVATIDIVRGLALFGILAANIRGFAGPAVVYFQPHLLWGSFPDRLAQAFIDAFVQGKFITIFAFLFGAGFAIQLERSTRSSSRLHRVYARRLFVLILIGLVHGLFIWFGDILLIYGIVGFFLILFRNVKDRVVVPWAIGLYFFPIFLVGFVVLVSLLAGAAPPGPPPPSPDDLRELVETFRNGSWGEIQLQRMKEAVSLNWGFALVGGGPQILGIFLFGLLAWRRRFFQPAPESLPKYRRAMAWGLGFGIAGNVTEVSVRWIADISMFSFSPMSFALAVLRALAVPALSLGYVCLIILLCQRSDWFPRLQRYGAIGRTALTSYLFQSVAGTLLFYSYGLRLFALWGPALLLIPTVIIYGVQAGIMPVWLRYYLFGPVEWLWRSLTYGKKQPMRRVVEV